jgi:hypothetical protein
VKEVENKLKVKGRHLSRSVPSRLRLRTLPAVRKEWKLLIKQQRSAGVYAPVGEPMTINMS